MLFPQDMLAPFANAAGDRVWITDSNGLVISIPNSVRDICPAAVADFKVQSGTFGDGYDNTLSRLLKSHSGGTLSSASGILRTSIILPPQFLSFYSVSIDTQRTAPTSTLQIKMLKGGVGDPNLNGVGIRPTANSVWQTKSFTPAGTYSPGDEVVFQFDFTTLAGVTVYLSNFQVIINQKIM